MGTDRRHPRGSVHRPAARLSRAPVQRFARRGVRFPRSRLAALGIHFPAPRVATVDPVSHCVGSERPRSPRRRHVGGGSTRSGRPVPDAIVVGRGRPRVHRAGCTPAWIQPPAHRPSGARVSRRARPLSRPHRLLIVLHFAPQATPDQSSSPSTQQRARSERPHVQQPRKASHRDRKEMGQSASVTKRP
jgi:hypothetical protein